jgi:TRAP transporter TAXI family solute receptor
MRAKLLHVIALAPIAVCLAAGFVWAQLPRTATIGTHATGTGFNSIGIGIATVASRHTSISVRVQPSAGPPAWLPAMERGETDMGVLTSADAVTSYKGIVLYKKPNRNSRILVVGGSLHVGFIVAKESPIETVADLKGKRVPSDFPGIPIVRLNATALLASAGLTFDDVVKVPVADLVSNYQAFLEGRTDASWQSVASPGVEEANARRGGVKFISALSTPEAAKKMGEIAPGTYPSIRKAGSATGIIRDMPLMTTDTYLIASKDFSDEAAYQIVKVLWEHNDELGAAHPLLKDWQRDRMASDKAFIPYHPGAIRFFREKQVWSKEMDALQAKLLSQ